MEPTTIEQLTDALTKAGSDRYVTVTAGVITAACQGFSGDDVAKGLAPIARQAVAPSARMQVPRDQIVHLIGLLEANPAPVEHLTP